MARAKARELRHRSRVRARDVVREELLRAEDMGNYYRIPADSRDLNYNKFFDQGEKISTDMEDYTSHNTKRLNVQEIKKVLMKLEEIKEFING